MKPKGSIKKDNTLLSVPYYHHLYKRVSFFYARHLYLRMPETGHPPQPRHTGQLRLARRGALLDIAHDDRRFAGSARSFGPERHTADFRGLLPERRTPPHEIALDSRGAGTFWD